MTQISAIIPTYNRAHLVERAIRSALDQTLPAAEVIVVDDGSTDGTREVVERFGNRVRYMHQLNCGAAIARNAGAAAASSEWLAFLDSDDIWQPDFLERIASVIDATNGRADTYFMDLAEEGCERTFWERGGLEINGAYELRDDAADWFMLPWQPTTTQTTVIRRRAYWEAGGQRPELVCRHDTHLFFRLGLSGPACAVRGVGAVLGCGATERLTRLNAPTTLAWSQDTIMLFDDIRRRHARDLARHHRRELRRRHAREHWLLGRLLLRERSRGSLSAFAWSVALSPGLLPAKLVHMATGRYGIGAMM